ncbi:hypothetical protein C9374_000636 [Naegleria lovaniensis]|uniref:Epidermal growth factor receptor substrate 15-like 1 n=1 Tax=Naegleria lovaniensis TaxID=51637 RepID=A0AA88GWR5_NAELO|nr:uncharacterized protein C9374_000636 [Naegleria lovaniensis]KAG2388472.1 hypothetical protein C9374_000636 [Naegleria lovaniensis]
MSFPHMQRFNDLDNEFHLADRDRDNLLNPGEAKAYFDQFQLPLPVMKFIWTSAKTSQAPGLTVDEFKHAMSLIRQELTNPGSLPVGSGGSPANFHPPQSPGFDYSIKQEERDQYETNFSNLARGKYTIPYDECMNFFSKAGLPNDILNTIFQLADFERNKVLDKDEFVIAMHLVRLKRKMPNIPIPMQLPPVLIPPSKQSLVGAGTPSGMSSPPLRPRSESTTSMDSINNGPPTLVPSSGTLGFGGPPPLGMSNNFGGSFSGPPPLSNNFGSPNMMGGSSGPVTVGPVRDLENQVNRVLDETRMINQQMFPLRQSVEQNDLRLNSLRERKADLENDLNQVRQEFENLKMQNQAKSEEIAQLESQSFRLEQERLEFQNQIQRVKQEVMRLEQIYEKANLSYQSASGIVETLRSELEQNLNELVKHKDELLRLKNSNQQGDEFAHGVEQEITNAKNELQAVREQLQQARMINEELQTKVRNLQLQKQDIEQSTFNTKTELSGLISQNEDLKNQLSRCQQDLENQKQKSVPNAKLVKLTGLIKKIQEYIHDFDSALGEEFPNQPASELKVVPPVTAKVASPVTTPSQPKPTVPLSNSSFGNDDFGFGNDAFGNSNLAGNKIPSTQPPVSSGFSANFGDDFGFDSKPPSTQTSNGFGNDDFGFDSKPPSTTNSTKPPSSQPSSTKTPSFDNDDFGFDSKPSSGGFGNDDFGFDSKPAATNTTKPKSGFDDFGFDSKPASNGGFGSDDFGFDIKPAKTSQPSSTKTPSFDNDDFGFGSTTTATKGFDDFGDFGTSTSTTNAKSTKQDDFGFDSDFSFSANKTANSSDPWNDFAQTNSVITKEAPKSEGWADFGDSF